MKNGPDVLFLSLRVAPDWETLDVAKGAQLPHWSADRAIYHVCFRLADSVPASQRQKWLDERDVLLKDVYSNGGEVAQEQLLRVRQLFTEKLERYLDQGAGACLLRRAECSAVVSDALRFFDGQRYDLHAWCVMPNHVHVIVEPKQNWAIGKIKHGWTSFTANVINRKVGRTGVLWQHEPYDHIIRSVKEYVFQVQYVWNNPDKAGITALRWRKEWA